MPIDNAGFKAKQVPQTIQNLNTAIEALQKELEEHLAMQSRNLLGGNLRQSQFYDMASSASEVLDRLRNTSSDAQDVVYILSGNAEFATNPHLGPTRSAEERFLDVCGKDPVSEIVITAGGSRREPDYDCVRNDAC